MTTTAPATQAVVPAGSRLEDLLAAYVELKPQADEIAARLKAVTDGIKAELTAASPGAQRIDVDHPALTQPLRLSYIESWTLDAKRMKTEAPELYVSFARRGGSWQLRGVKA